MSKDKKFYCNKAQSAQTSPDPTSVGLPSPQLRRWVRGEVCAVHIRARELRKNQTVYEARLWKYLRNRKLHGFKFRRQHPLGPFIADFYCVEVRLVVELDGGYHYSDDQQEYDQHRDQYMKDANIRVLRIQNDELNKNIHQVLKKITDMLWQ